MANAYHIDITARDKTGDAFKALNDNVERIARGTPLEKLTKGFSTIFDKGRSFHQVGTQFRILGEQANIAAGGTGEAASGLLALEAVAGPLGLAIGAIGTGLVAAGTAAVNFEIPMANAGAASGRTAFALGTTTKALQEFQLAGEEMGVSADTTAAAMDGVNNAIYGARWGTDSRARDELARLGLTMHFLKDGSVDTKREMLDLAYVFGKMNAQQREKAAGILGVTGALPFLSLGYDRIKEAMDRVDRSGAVMSDDLVKQSGKIHQSLEQIKLDFDGIKNAGFGVTAGPFAAFLGGLTKLTGMGSDFAQGATSAPTMKLGTFHAINALQQDLAAFFGKHLAGPEGASPPASGPVPHGPAGFAALERKWGLPAGLIDQVWRQESSRGHNLGPSRAGALGHFGFMPKTAARYGVADPNNLDQSAAGAAHYLADLMKRYGSVPKALAAYNWGEKHLDADIAKHGDDWRGHLPRETSGYLAEIGRQLAQKVPTGTVKVDVTVHGAPAGTRTTVAANGRGVSAGAKITQSLPGGSG